MKFDATLRLLTECSLQIDKVVELKVLFVLEIKQYWRI